MPSKKTGSKRCCPTGSEVNEATGRCRKSCPSGVRRYANGRCAKATRVRVTKTTRKFNPWDDELAANIVVKGDEIVVVSRSDKDDDIVVVPRSVIGRKRVIKEDDDDKPEPKQPKQPRQTKRKTNGSNKKQAQFQAHKLSPTKVRFTTGLTWAEALDRLKNSTSFAASLTKAILSARFRSVFFEASKVVMSAPFEFVVIEADLDHRGDPSSFHAHLRQSINTFTSLGGDSLLVAPNEDNGPFAHLIIFLANATPAQIARLWKAAGGAVERRLKETGKPVWLSTSGKAVPWLHVRIDSYPKYFHHMPYTQ